MRQGRRLTPLPLSAAHVSETASLLASALFDDPAYAFLFPEPERRPSGLANFFERHLATHVPHGCSFVCVAEDGNVDATVTVRPPGGIAQPPVLLLARFLSFALAEGSRVARRLWQLKEAYEIIERRAAAGERYWHVHMMAVRPDLQGQGVGSALLEHVLSRRPSATEPVVLTTHQAINVRFYERAGFQVAHEESLQLSGAPAYRVWAMRREVS